MSKQSREVRTRFAPSPTGYLHLGSLRTALFNWLWAQKNGGQFILRLEDTDQARTVAGAAEQYLDDLTNLGLNWDWGPDKPSSEFGSCIQSDRLKTYRQIAEQLLELGVAYRDYTTSEQLQELRHVAQQQKRAFVFRKTQAELMPSAPGQPYTIRIAIPEDLVITWQDTVKGPQSWQSSDVGDFVALKSDGWPTYHLANVVDDHLMSISHVIRADEWLSSTPRHLYLFDCLSWPRPDYVHVPPVLLGEGGQKISKRDQGGRVAELLEAGYLKEALLNYLSLLGWNPKTTQEIFTLKQLVEAFEIGNIQVSGGRFDPVRLDWFNGRHLRALPTEELRAQAEAWWSPAAANADRAYKHQILELVYERLKKWSELAELSDFFFETPPTPTTQALVKESRLSDEQIAGLLDATLVALKEPEFTAGNLELCLYKLAQEAKVSPSKYFTLLRMKLTGKKVAPGLFETMHVLGLEQCLKRLAAN